MRLGLRTRLISVAVLVCVSLWIQGCERKKDSRGEIPNFYRYGDSSSFYVLKKKEMPVGNYFTVRDGTKNYLLLMTGMYFDDPEVWKELIEPKLKQFSVYKPA